MEKQKIIILDDMPGCQLWAKLALNTDLYDVVCPDCSQIVCENADIVGFISILIKTENPSIILTDIMYDGDPYGFDISQFVSEEYPNIPVIGMSNRSYHDDEIKSCGMFTLLDKGDLKRTLDATIQECLNLKE